MNIKQSQTQNIRRSQINLNPLNPKLHSKEEIDLQKKNIKNVGYLGGIIWNERSGNIIDGHRRVIALDLIQHYDGTENTDYDIKVEVVDFDDKTEKQQMTYSAIGNGKADYNLIANYIEDINPKEVGLSEAEYREILILQDKSDWSNGAQMEDVDFSVPAPRPVFELSDEEESNDDIVQHHAEKPKMTREQVIAEKDFCRDIANKRINERDLYAFIIFESEEQKDEFCALLNVLPTNSLKITGAQVLSLIE
jgi:uncharacterized protein (DUF39 family)